MRLGIVVTGLTALLLSAGLAGAGLIGGGGSIRFKLDPGGPKLLPVTLPFKGGERACVILVGDHKPPMDLALYILDEAGKEVAKDTDGGDYCAVIWYPPRDGNYKIVAQNKGNVWNECYLSIK